MDRASGEGTREQRLEEALQESEERFRRLVEAAKDYAIWFCCSGVCLQSESSSNRGNHSASIIR